MTGEQIFLERKRRELATKYHSPGTGPGAFSGIVRIAGQSAFRDLWENKSKEEQDEYIKNLGLDPEDARKAEKEKRERLQSMPTITPRIPPAPSTSGPGGGNANGGAGATLPTSLATSLLSSVAPQVDPNTGLPIGSRTMDKQISPDTGPSLNENLSGLAESMSEGAPLRQNLALLAEGVGVLNGAFGILDEKVNLINESMDPWAQSFESSLDRVNRANELFTSSTIDLANRLKNIEGQINRIPGFTLAPPPPTVNE
jgi:hypothetical protein